MCGEQNKTRLVMRYGFLKLITSIALSLPLSSQADTNSAMANGCSISTEFQNAALPDLIEVALNKQPQLLIANEAVARARANLVAARTPFFPAVNLSFQSERFVPSTITQPIVVGNTVIGGTEPTKTSYGSIGMNWNLYDGGRDIAAFNASKSDLKASEEGLTHQINETIVATLNAYVDVYKAQQDASAQAHILALQQEIEQRAELQFRQGTTTTLAISQAQVAVLGTAQQLYQACRAVADKSAVLAQTVGLHLGPDELYRIQWLLPAPSGHHLSAADWQAIIEGDPAVVTAKANVTTAEYKLKEAKAAYGPTLALEGRKDYLGQNAESWREANHITPNGYRIGLQIQQPLMPLTSEHSAIQAAKSDLRKAQASYQQTLLEVEAKYHSAFNAVRESESSLLAAKLSLAQAQELLVLTQSQFANGRADQDKVQQAQIAIEKANDAVTQAVAQQDLDQWLVIRATEPRGFPTIFLDQLGIGRHILTFDLGH